MKKTLFSSVIFIATCCHAYADNIPTNIFGNTISAHNISMLQHKITDSVFNTKNNKHVSPKHTTHNKQKYDLKLYGRTPVYGTMSLYGEYNDDGRSGGDSPIPTLNNTWVQWEHINDTLQFDNFPSIDTKSHIAMAGLDLHLYTSGKTQNIFGIYTGYVHSKQDSSDLAIKSNGGYFGIFNHTKISDFVFDITANGGLLDNSSDTELGDEKYTNFWFSATIDTTYTIHLDSTFALRPGLRLGYIWIQSDTTTDNANISNFNIYDFAPGIDAIKHIANGWYGTLGVKYVTSEISGGEIKLNDDIIPELKLGKYYEYGLSLSKSVSNMNFTATIGRHDGARYGWFGGIKAQYIF